MRRIKSLVGSTPTLFFVFFLLHIALFLIFTVQLHARELDLGLEDEETLLSLYAPTEAEVRNLYSQLTLDQKIGQLLLIGFKGHTVGEGANKVIRDLRPGGLIIFGRNISTAGQLSKLSQDLRTQSFRASTLPPLLAIDQEGGTVARIKMSPPQPSALAVGRTNSYEVAEKMGYYTGTVLKAFGINMNLAPVLDIADPTKPNFLGTRSFANNAEIVGEMSLSYAQGLERAGVISTLKHFPGHGNEVSDPHFDVPVIEDDFKTLTETRLKPFKFLMDKFSPPAIMVAHMAIPNVDPTASAATYSKVLITHLLRKKWNYNGLVVTDDIDMRAARSSDRFGQATQALLAGADLIMVAWNRRTQYRAFRDLKKSVQTGVISDALLQESVSRVLRTKLRYRLREPQPKPTLKEIKLALRNPQMKTLIDDVTKMNLKRHFVRGVAALPPANKKLSKVLFFSRSHSFQKTFGEKATQNCCKTQSLLSLEDMSLFLEKYKNTLAVVHVSGKSTATWLNKMASHLRKRIIVVNTNSPALILSPDSYQKIVNVYTYHPEVGGFLAQELFPERGHGSSEYTYLE
ncbi:MAG: glycoside hydrolase family 3 protein [Bdellovibrionales bacterium]